MHTSKELTLEQRIGVSTLFMSSTGVSLWEALDQAYEAGFGSIEIIPADFHCISGYPRAVMSVGFNLDRISDSEIDRLGESVARFPCRHVHSPCRGLNIASRNPGIAGESARQFMQCASLAARIEAQRVTFHLGIPERGDEINYDEFVIERNIEFGKRIADFAEKHNLLAGYENLGSFPTPVQMQTLLDGIDSKRFGLQFDVGHSFMVPPHDPFAWLQLLGDRIVGLHLHGTYHRPDRGYENHQSLEMEACIDLSELKRRLTDYAFSGSITLEILSNTFPEYLERCKRSKSIFLEL